MPNTIFADESGTDPAHKCYGIGALVIPDSGLETLERIHERLCVKHGIQSEVKWQKIQNSYGRINYAVDIIKYVLTKNWQFSAIVVRKETYNNWHDNKESAFYKTYTYLLTDRIKYKQTPHTIFIDDRSDSYDKQHEVIDVVGGHMLVQLADAGTIKSVTKEDSAAMPGIQVSDLLTGAIVAAHHLYLAPDATIHPGKELCLKRLARILGWRHLHHDTYPNEHFNIWHFPIDYRATPSTREVKPDLDVSRVSRSTYKKWMEKKKAQSK